MKKTDTFYSKMAIILSAIFSIILIIRLRK